MLTREENELLTRVGPNAPMGQMLRRYWIPACLASEVPEPDGDPVRVRLLGEDLLAFRDTNGRVGLIGEFCPHRSASLFFGRNEECGIRCLYHGWKMDVHGNVLDTPVEPDESDFKNRVKHLSYLVEERGDVIWTYMGPRDRMPPFPEFEWTAVPSKNRVVIKIHEAANWVQALEGAIDSSHSSVLHQDLLMQGAKVRRPSRDTAPRLEAETTSYGFRYGAVRKPLENADVSKYVRVTLFCAPFHCFVPPKGYGSMHIFVPADDENTWFFGVNFHQTEELDADRIRKQRGAVVGVDLDTSFRKSRSLANNFLQDRAAMRRGESFTGVSSIPAQDMIMQESMGPINDRTREHLGTSDVAVIRFRRIMLDSVRAFQEGADPVGIGPSIPYGRLRSEETLVPVETPWQAVGAFAGEYVPEGEPTPA